MGIVTLILLSKLYSIWIYIVIGLDLEIYLQIRRRCCFVLI